MAQLSSTRPYLLRALHAWMEDNGLTPHLVVDAEVPGVVVPRGSVQDGRIVLDISYEATRALNLGSEVISFGARFGARQLEVVVPIAAALAIFARENGQGMTFTPEPEAEAQAEAAPMSSAASSAPPPESPPDSPKDPPPTRPHLKVVK